MKVIYAPGVFDLLHRGHLNLLWRAKALGDVLVVGCVTDAGTAAYKGRAPVECLDVRMAAIARLGIVDAVVPQATTDPTPNLERFRPDILVHGDDWTALREGHAALAEYGCEWVTLPYTTGISSTMLRAAR